MSRIGFIGLGVMGKPMAKNLINGGYELIVYNRSHAAVEELLALGARPADSPREVAEQADVVITMLPDSPQVEEVIAGPNGVIEGIRSGSIVVDMSSINPMVIRQLSELLQQKGSHLLDAPVSGGEIGAIEGILAIMVGGPEQIVEQVRPILEKMGRTITRVGDVGAGNTVKLINQMIVAVNIASVAEALAFGKQAGVDPHVAYEAIKGGLAASRVLDTKIANMAQESFKPGFRIELHRKDLRNAIQLADEIGFELDLTRQMSEHFDQLIENGYGAEDHSALYRTFKGGSR